MAEDKKTRPRQRIKPLDGVLVVLAAIVALIAAALARPVRWLFERAFRRDD